MEFGKYLGKGIWGLADKALPVVYGLAYVVLVIRVLPAEEFGNFVLIQEIFLVISGLAQAFALQPLLKFAAEGGDDLKQVVSAALPLNLGFIAAASLLCIGGANLTGALLNSPTLAPLMFFVPAMLAASFIRNFTLTLLQSRYRFQEVFWIDAMHFLGAPLGIWVVSHMHLFSSALALILINVVSLSASSVLGLVLARSLFRVTLRPIRNEILKVWNYGKYSLGGNFSYLVYSRADTFLLAMFTGPIPVAGYNSVKVFTKVYDMVTQVMQMFILPATSRLSVIGEQKSLKVMVEKAILFFTVAMVPVFLLFLFAPPFLIDVLYKGKYMEAALTLQVFALLALVAPLLAIGTNVLMGLGEARISFVLGAQMLGISLLLYLVLIPWLGETGAALGYVLSSYIVAWLTVVKMNRFIPVTVAEVFRRHNDMISFVKNQWVRFLPR
jgi:O-antigen/teichoic acid export membrane protein